MGMLGLFTFFRTLNKASSEEKENVKATPNNTLGNPLEGHERYEHLADVNSGTFGFVAKAKDRETGKIVAIKFLPRGCRIQSCVEREILNHKTLCHPHVIQFKEVFLTSKYLAIVMEYADQGDLFHYVRGSGRLREDVARWIFQQLIFGLDYCHRKGIASRDIKLENILLQNKPQRPLAKLCDFGYSKHDIDSAPTSRVGTPDYMSPEIFSIDGRCYDAKKADLWSCGVVLYVMVVGKYPFSHKEDTDYGMEEQHRLVLKRVMDLQYIIPPFVSASCADLLRRLLDPNPETRITIPEIIRHSWHKIGLPPSAADMNDNLLNQSFNDKSQSDEDIKAIVEMAGRLNDSIDSDTLIDRALLGSTSFADSEYD